MKLHERFADKGYHTSIATTFGIDFDAYEGVVLPRLRGAGCNNNLVLMDARMMSHVLETSSALPSHAGRHYTLTGVAPSGVFHPKILLQLGRNAGRLIVGSANLTAPGLGGNLEVAGVVLWPEGDPVAAQLMASAWQYLSSFIDGGQEALGYQLDWIRRRTRWLFDATPAGGALSLPNGDAVAFLTNGGSTGIGEQFVELVGRAQVVRLISVSPYWDPDLSALRHLSSRLGADTVAILAGALRSSIPRDALNEMDNVTVHALGAFAQNRFTHAKVLIAQTKEADHVLFGSANCTVAALGKGNFRGINEEACLYRRMPVGAAVAALGLESSFEKDNEIDKDSLPPFVLTPEIPLENALQRHAGRFEASEGRLLWWPSLAYSLVDADTLELLDTKRNVLACTLTLLFKDEEGCLRFDVAGLEDLPSFARVRVESVYSAPAIVVVVDAVKNVVREARSRQSERIAEQLAAETEAGLWLLEAFDLLSDAEADEAGVDDVQEHTDVARKKSRSGDVDGELAGRTLTYEQFIEGRKLRSDVHSSGRSDFAGSELALVQNFLNRLIGVKTPTTVESSSDEDSIRVALAVRDLSDDESGDFDALGPVGIRSDDTKRSAEAIRAVAARNVATREKMVTAVANFNDHVMHKAVDAGFTHKDILRLRVILMIVLAAARPVDEYAVMDVRPIQVLYAKGDKSWPLLTGKLLSTFFSGENPALKYLMIERKHNEIPSEILECWALCLWLANGCALALSRIPLERRLFDIFQKLRQRVYLATMLDEDQFLGERFMLIYSRLSKHFAVALHLDADELDGAHRVSVERCRKLVV